MKKSARRKNLVCLAVLGLNNDMLAAQEDATWQVSEAPPVQAFESRLAQTPMLRYRTFLELERRMCPGRRP